MSYVVCRRCNPKEITDCKVVLRKSVAGEHLAVVYSMAEGEEEKENDG